MSEIKSRQIRPGLMLVCVTNKHACFALRFIGEPARKIISCEDKHVYRKGEQLAPNAPSQMLGDNYSRQLGERLSRIPGIKNIQLDGLSGVEFHIVPGRPRHIVINSVADALSDLPDPILADVHHVVLTERKRH